MIVVAPPVAALAVGAGVAAAAEATGVAAGTLATAPAVGTAVVAGLAGGETVAALEQPAARPATTTMVATITLGFIIHLVSEPSHRSRFERSGSWHWLRGRG
jgi:hypothetical protein